MQIYIAFIVQPAEGIDVLAVEPRVNDKNKAEHVELGSIEIKQKDVSEDVQMIPIEQKHKDPQKECGWFHYFVSLCN